MIRQKTSAIADGGTDALAADGGVIRIRPVRSTDSGALTHLHEYASKESLYRRFVSHAGHYTIAAEVTRLVREPGDSHATLVATEKDRLVGVASYEVLPDRTKAEFSVFVAEDAHGRGIGTLLLEHLAVLARRHGVPDIYGEIMPANAPMLRVAHDLGRPVHTNLDAGFVEVHLATDATPTDVVDTRDLAAARQSLRPLFRPSCVAVVGAGRSPGGIGHTVLRTIVDGGFIGTVYAVNPHADRIAGTVSYPSFDTVPTAPDLVVIAVPAPAVAGTLAEAAAAGARAAVVLSSGFGEDGPEGRARQAELVRIARRTGMRLIGPNCLGFLTNDPTVRLHATFAAGAPVGGLAVASQSGAVGISLLDQATRSGTGIASFVSLGNKADVSGNDLLSYWYDDPYAEVIALYLESLGNPRRFARIARTVGRRKPVLVVKSGRTVAGSRAGASHTAAAAAPDATVDALFAQAGVVRCDGLGELLDTARIMLGGRLPAGPRIAVVGNAGGINVLCADAADTAGLLLPDLPDDVVAAIRAAAPTVAAATNPVDLGAAASAPAVGATIRAVAPHVDMIVVAYGATLAADVPAILTEIGTALDDVATPAVAVLLGVTDAPTSLGTRRVPVYRLPEAAIGAIGRAVRYAAWRDAPLGSIPALSGIDPSRTRRAVDEALIDGGGWQPPRVAREILAGYGIATVADREASTAEAAVIAADTIGFPIVVKSADPNLVHKSDIGGVRVGLTDGDAVRDAYLDIAAATGDPRVLVQAQAAPGVELVAGVVHDPLFGSVLMCGLGGVYTELLGDRSLRLLPLTDRDAAAMWRGLRGAPLLTGYRGTLPADTAAVEDLLLRLGRLADDLPEIAELDCNPVIVGPSGVSIVDVKLRLARVGIEPDPALRALREPV